jgi:hypothetical protein
MPAASPRMMVVRIAALSLVAAVVGGAASAGTLDRIGQDKTIRICYHGSGYAEQRRHPPDP